MAKRGKIMAEQLKEREIAAMELSAIRGHPVLHADHAAFFRPAWTHLGFKLVQSRPPSWLIVYMGPCRGFLVALHAGDAVARPVRPDKSL